MRGKSRCEDCQFFDYDEETDSNYWKKSVFNRGASIL